MTSSSDWCPTIPTHPIDLCGRSAELRFTVRRPPTGEVSPCGHRPSGGDVACSVDVGVAPPSRAGLALEDRLALAVSGRDMPARGATLRRVRSRDLLNPAEGLMLQTCEEQAPPTAFDGAVEPTFLGDSHTWLLGGAARGTGHRPHVQSLDPDHVELVRKVRGGFLDPVLAPVPVTRYQFCNCPFRLFPTVGTTLAARKPLLQHSQPLRFTRGQAGCMQHFAGRQRRRHGNPAVDAHHSAVSRTGDRVRDVCERDVPTAGPISGDAVGLDTIWYRPRQSEPHPPDLGHPYPAEVTVQPLDVTRLHPDLPKPLVHAGFAPFRAAVRASEEVLHRLREIPQRLLLHRLTPGTKPCVLGSRLRQLRGLLHKAGSLPARLPVPLLLHRQIPHITRVAAMRQQPLLLLRSRQQSKPRHIRTITTDTDIPDRRTPAHLGTGYLPATKSGVCRPRRLR